MVGWEKSVLAVAPGTRVVRGCNAKGPQGQRAKRECLDTAVLKELVGKKLSDAD